MLSEPNLDGGFRRFLADRELAALTARDRSGRLWVAPLVGEPGYLDAHAKTLRVHVAPTAADPLDQLPAGQPIGLIAIEFATRRRVRINGLLTKAAANELEIAVDQAFGNCPQYIQRRIFAEHPSDNAPATAEPARWTSQLAPEHESIVHRADTFFLGTVHPHRGADASHRGGTRGFVRVEDGQLWWPDYPGNNMFNSLGNLAVDKTAALLFIDFTTGSSLQLSGTAEVDWIRPGTPGDDGGTGRRVRFTPDRIVLGAAPALRTETVEPYVRNPSLT
ncbi:MAG TPA: pyridoxamine 5'-phosphate oxidase family protein [Pseudonocardiaceae bacterium]|nr:pyridoxamine 5'-phosphate oxidase family protein [Pseudonocardiaceae bacterium]